MKFTKVTIIGMYRKDGKLKGFWEHLFNKGFYNLVVGENDDGQFGFYIERFKRCPEYLLVTGIYENKVIIEENEIIELCEEEYEKILSLTIDIINEKGEEYFIGRRYLESKIKE